MPRSFPLSLSISSGLSLSLRQKHLRDPLSAPLVLDAGRGIRSDELRDLVLLRRALLLFGFLLPGVAKRSEEIAIEALLRID